LSLGCRAGYPCCTQPASAARDTDRGDGFLAAILTNDVVVFALTPLVSAGLIARDLDPRPYLVALAAANAGSAATLIGNPQNILIGQAGGLPFWNYIVFALPPTIFSLAAVYFAVA